MSILQILQILQACPPRRHGQLETSSAGLLTWFGRMSKLATRKVLSPDIDPFVHARISAALDVVIIVISSGTEAETDQHGDGQSNGKKIAQAQYPASPLVASGLYPVMSVAMLVYAINGSHSPLRNEQISIVGC